MPRDAVEEVNSDHADTFNAALVVIFDAAFESLIQFFIGFRMKMNNNVFSFPHAFVSKTNRLPDGSRLGKGCHGEAFGVSDLCGGAAPVLSGQKPLGDLREVPGRWVSLNRWDWGVMPSISFSPRIAADGKKIG